MLDSSPGYQPKPGVAFPVPLYLSPVPVGDVGSPQTKQMASDIIRYIEVEAPQIFDL